MRGRLIRTVIIGLLLIYIAGMIIWWMKLPDENVLIVVPQGSSASIIAKELKKEKIISSAGIFLNLVKLTGNTKKLKAGTYELSPRDSIFKVIKMLSEGRAKYVRVTVPEGFTGVQIAERLSLEGIVDREKFLSIVNERKLEGYLFPETYYFEKNTPEDMVVNKMLEQFNKNYTPEMRKRANGMRKMNEKKIITLASIIEKEAVVPQERPLISAVFHNRLKKRMYLESCATILYALGEHKDKLTYEDLDIKSPYNTYRRFGLPPGPICSPGLESIKAALYPADTEDLFFVAKGSGTHTFSQYFKDHIKEKIKRKRRLRNK
ncbi:MAG: endolytic transglycosylase MltG [Endomicrobiales bacterium]|nr:endolytic transglycosylase MltG [Endomicrobiales bacterium]